MDWKSCCVSFIYQLEDEPHTENNQIYLHPLLSRTVRRIIFFMHNKFPMGDTVLDDSMEKMQKLIQKCIFFYVVALKLPYFNWLRYVGGGILKGPCPYRKRGLGDHKSSAIVYRIMTLKRFCHDAFTFFEWCKTKLNYQFSRNCHFNNYPYTSTNLGTVCFHVF